MFSMSKQLELLGVDMEYQYERNFIQYPFNSELEGPKILQFLMTDKELIVLLYDAEE